MKVEETGKYTIYIIENEYEEDDRMEVLEELDATPEEAHAKAYEYSRRLWYDVYLECPDGQTCCYINGKVEYI